MSLIVSKFGGSSLATPQAIQRVQEIIQDDEKRKVIVLSAPGKRNKDDIKVTDLLIELATTRDKKLIPHIANRYRELYSAKACKGIEEHLSWCFNKNILETEYLNLLKSFGERANAYIFAKHTGHRFIDPRSLFRVTDQFGNASILPISKVLIQEKIQQELMSHEAVIVPGFYGYTLEGKIATFSRGGSDLTGSYLAAAISAETYENFTDRSGVFAAHPELVIKPKKIKTLTYKEMRDLSYSGFGILHAAAMIPVEANRVPIHIRSTFEYPETGTFVAHERIANLEDPVVGVAYQDGFCSFNIDSSGLNDQVGIACDLLHLFKKRNISVEYIPSTIDDISIVVRQDQMIDATVNNILDEMYATIQHTGTVDFQEHLGCLVVAGKGLKGSVGIAGEIQRTLADNGVNIVAISQGTKERCIVYIINSYYGKTAVNAVYDKYLR